MNKKWDYDVPSIEIFKEMLRVAKPGAFLLCFSGSRTFHRMAVNIEDAGWEIRDTIMWLYGSGFPKSYNISKGIDKHFGVEREVVGKRITGTIGRPTSDGTTPSKSNPNHGVGQQEINITAPATHEAQQWDGYGTALKPAFEPIIVAMKPVDKNFVNNALTHGVAGLNIDGCRVGSEEITISNGNGFGDDSILYGKDINNNKGNKHKGRFPANIILDEEAGKMLDEQSGIESSRFFYCAKASKSERNAGSEGLEEKESKTMSERNPDKTGNNNNTGQRPALHKNNHPTVKPLKLMEYLCNLTRTPNGGIVLDPFAGSGTTLCACINTDRKYIGIEMNEEYIEIIKKRVEYYKKDRQLSLRMDF